MAAPRPSLKSPGSGQSGPARFPAFPPTAQRRERLRTPPTSSAKVLCNNQFVPMEFLERGFQTSVAYVTPTYLLHIQQD